MSASQPKYRASWRRDARSSAPLGGCQAAPSRRKWRMCMKLSWLLRKPPSGSPHTPPSASAAVAVLRVLPPSAAATCTRRVGAGPPERAAGTGGIGSSGASPTGSCGCQRASSGDSSPASTAGWTAASPPTLPSCAARPHATARRKAAVRAAPPAAAPVAGGSLAAPAPAGAAALTVLSRRRWSSSKPLLTASRELRPTAGLAPLPPPGAS
mmetsp:Transcript_32915/g.84007  ORF Transcript_32915/g.84007 Transcript_32915/m.84007 type:complete len:211 (-) Transcript_32915:15-647(-)